jgi:hypothetical protein
MTVSCGVRQVIVDRSCIDPSMLKQGLALPTATCAVICPEAAGLPLICSVNTFDVPPGTVNVSCPGPYCVGRRPSGLAQEASSVAGMMDYLVESAQLEAASVEAFRVLRNELRQHGAPRRLLRAASRAKRDEVRHARTTRALARRFGGSAPDPIVAPATKRPLEAFATENAVEGCVRETYGALVATFQAHAARDRSVRAAMKRIARDETRHALLAWNVAKWLEPTLSKEQKEKVKTAREAAVNELAKGLDQPAPSWAREAGLPRRQEALALLGQLTQALWA